MHRATEVGSLKVRMEALREGHTAVALDHEGAATSALTKCAFSWKFALRSSPLAYNLACLG
jgi:hypothetical protein